MSEAGGLLKARVAFLQAWHSLCGPLEQAEQGRIPDRPAKRRQAAMHRWGDVICWHAWNWYPLQVSPDGNLIQGSTVSDRIPFTFDGGAQHGVPGAYLEFAERKVLPEYAHLQVRLKLCHLWLVLL